MSTKKHKHAKIYELNLFGMYRIDEEDLIIRVPWWWIYQSIMESGTWWYQSSSTFIPYNDEYKNAK